MGVIYIYCIPTEGGIFVTNMPEIMLIVTIEYKCWHKELSYVTVRFPLFTWHLQLAFQPAFSQPDLHVSTPNWDSNSDSPTVPRVDLNSNPGSGECINGAIVVRTDLSHKMQQILEKTSYRLYVTCYRYQPWNQWFACSVQAQVPQWHSYIGSWCELANILAAFPMNMGLLHFQYQSGWSVISNNHWS